MTSRTVSIISATDIGAILRLLREETGLTQRDMAGLCNVSLLFLNQVEQGKSTAQIGKVLEVCRRHGIEWYFTCPQSQMGKGSKCRFGESCGDKCHQFPQIMRRKADRPL